MIRIRLSLFLILGLSAAACSTGPSPDGSPKTLTLMTHDSFAVSEETIRAFEQDNDVTVQLLPAGDAGAALNQAILAKDNPLADLFYGVDNSFMTRALDAGIFLPYESPALADVPDALQLDHSHRLSPVNFGDVCLNYDKGWFAESGLELPGSLVDLADPQIYL